MNEKIELGEEKWFVRKCFVSFDTLKLQISLAFFFLSFPSAFVSPSSSLEVSASLIFTTINISLNKFLMFLGVIIATLTKVLLSLPTPQSPFWTSQIHITPSLFFLASLCFSFFQFASFHCCHLTEENYYGKVSENNEATTTLSMFHYWADQVWIILLASDLAFSGFLFFSYFLRRHWNIKKHSSKMFRIKKFSAKKIFLDFSHSLILSEKAIQFPGEKICVGHFLLKYIY